MASFSEDDKTRIWDDFCSLINMSAKEQEQFLTTNESFSVGPHEKHPSKTARMFVSRSQEDARRILELRRKPHKELDDDDYLDLERFTAAVRHALAAPPSGDPTQTTWRYSLMNCGHDPLRAERRDVEDERPSPTDKWRSSPQPPGP